MRPTRVRALLLACMVASSATAARAQVVRLETTSREPMNNGQAVGTSDILPHAAASATASIAASCEQLASTTLPNATVAAARWYPAGEFTSGRTFQIPAFCRVMVTARPTTRFRHQSRSLAARRVERQAPWHRQRRLLRRDQLRRARGSGHERIRGGQHRHRPYRRSDGLRDRAPGKDRGLGLPVGARDDDDRQDRRRTRKRTRAGAVVLQRLLDRRTASAQRSAALSRRLRRHRRRRSREQPDQPCLRVSLVMARHARHGRNSDPSERQAAGAGEGRSRGV